MSLLSLQLFGGFALFIPDGDRVSVRLAKERALLAYLALHPGRKFTRNQLAGLLWSEQSEERARHSLSQALSSLTRAFSLTDSVIYRNRNEIVLEKGKIDADVIEFLLLARSDECENWRRAVDLYVDDLLVEFDFDEPGFEEWAFSMRVECRDQVMQAGLGYLSHSEESHTGQRISVASRLLRVDPIAEPVHQALIRLYLESGQPAAALRQFENCRISLQQELGIDPSPESCRLVRQAQISTAVESESRPDHTKVTSLKDTPSLIVTPIQNLSGDPGLDYLAYGMTEDITTELTRYRHLFVISHESSTRGGDQPTISSALCQRFGVRHAMRGSIRRHGQGYRVNLRLVDGDTGQNVWGERFDIGPQELADLPTAVVEQTIGHLATWLEQETLVRARSRPSESWSAYDHVLQGLHYHHKNWYGIKNTLRAIKHFERAVEIDPGCARAYAYLACAKSYPYFKDRRHDRLGPCTDLANHAIELDPTEAEAHRVLGGIHLSGGEHEVSRQHFERALQIHPGHSHIIAHAARYHIHTGDPETAIKLMGRAQQLNPLHLPWYWEHFGIAAFVAGDDRASLSAFGRMQSHSFYDQLYVAAANANLNRMRHAENSLAFVLERKPNLRLSNVSYLFPYRDRPDMDRVLSGLERAGLSWD